MQQRHRLSSNDQLNERYLAVLWRFLPPDLQPSLEAGHKMRHLYLNPPSLRSDPNHGPKPRNSILDNGLAQSANYQHELEFSLRGHLSPLVRVLLQKREVPKRSCSNLHYLSQLQLHIIMMHDHFVIVCSSWRSHWGWSGSLHAPMRCSHRGGSSRCLGSQGLEKGRRRCR